MNSNFQTPLPVCGYMASLIPKGVRTVLEPTPGDGNIVSCLSGYKVTAPADYFLLPADQTFDCVIMNPPFSENYADITNAPAEYKLAKGMRFGYYMLTECMKKADHIIALMPWFTVLDSATRLQHLKQFGIKSLTNLPRKVFPKARIQAVVIELEKGYTGSTEFKYFDFPK